MAVFLQLENLRPHMNRFLSFSLWKMGNSFIWDAIARNDSKDIQPKGYLYDPQLFNVLCVETERRNLSCLHTISETKLVPRKEPADVSGRLTTRCKANFFFFFDESGRFLWTVFIHSRLLFQASSLGRLNKPNVGPNTSKKWKLAHRYRALTMGEGHWHWYALKGLAKEYHLANFYDCRHDNVRENAIVTKFPRFLSAPVTLDEGHWNWHDLKGFTKYYHCVSFHDCSDDSVWENTNIFSRLSITPCDRDLGWRSLKLIWIERPCY